MSKMSSSVMSQKLALLSKILQKQKKPAINHSNNLTNHIIQEKTITQIKQKQSVTVNNSSQRLLKQTNIYKHTKQKKVQKLDKSNDKHKTQPNKKDSQKPKTRQEKLKQKQKAKKLQRSKSKKKDKKSKLIFQDKQLKIQNVVEQTENNHESLLDYMFPKNFEPEYQQKKQDNPQDVKSCRRSKFFHPALHTSQKPSQYQKLWVLGNGKVKDQFQITSWNINGIRSQKASKMLNLYLKDSTPQILCIIQTKIDYDAYKVKPIHIQGYSDYWSFCKCSSGYSGVAVFSKYLPLKVAQDLPQKQFSQQGRVLTLQFQHFFVVAVYVPAAGDHLQRLFYKVKQFEVSFHKYCNTLKQTKNVIICGDLNVARTQLDASISKTTEKGQGYTILQRKSLQSFLNTGWVDTYRYFHPSKKTISWFNFRRYGQKAIQHMKGKRLDYFLVNQSFMPVIKSSDVLMKITGRDHCPIQCTLDLRYLNTSV